MTSGTTTLTRLAAGALLLVLTAGCASGTAAPATPATSEASANAAASTIAGPTTAAPALPVRDATRRISVAWAGGQATGDTGRVAVPLGATVEIVVTSDKAEELHLHGYDLSAKVAAGGTATLTFAATIAGVFELEFHGAGRELLKLQVG
ncbi:hypothetical protein [Pseudonocardia sp. N23]|uniref:hypothetical protein n=1 Tax=Pseudonocardia sp. N23 TaxID=1987376 RepID=UPI000BFB300B|nr:hypothetical protein [Pseudonocardia sp. N23]GAY13017.1 hypothetical protein TOK_1746 [Pseudonocardia sp. N23]